MKLGQNPNTIVETTCWQNLWQAYFFVWRVQNHDELGVHAYPKSTSGKNTIDLLTQNLYSSWKKLRMKLALEKEYLTQETNPMAEIACVLRVLKRFLL